MKLFIFCAHGGKACDNEQYIVSFLLLHGINRGLMLKQSSALQYLLCLTQIVLAMSPLSNEMLFVVYGTNPLPLCIWCRVYVTLSTVGSLEFFVKDDSLVKEHSMAAQV